MADTVHVNDTGTLLYKTVTDDGVVVDLSTATRKELVILYTDQRIVLTGAFVGDGSDGELVFTSLVGTWTVAGNSREQVQFDLPTGSWSCRKENRLVSSKY
jgi:hypothetical protein